MLSVLDFFFKFLVVKDAIVSASMSSSQPSVCRLPSCPLPALASMSVFESRERSAGFYNGVVGLTFVLWCCTCTDIWIRIAVDAALAQMSESVLLLMLHLHRCLSVYCSWCCTCTDVWVCIALDVALAQMSESLSLFDAAPALTSAFLYFCYIWLGI